MRPLARKTSFTLAALVCAACGIDLVGGASPDEGIASVDEAGVDVDPSAGGDSGAGPVVIALGDASAVGDASLATSDAATACAPTDAGCATSTWSPVAVPI